MIFGDRLKQLRLKHNVTQQQLADYLGVNRTSIAGYETKGIATHRTMYDENLSEEAQKELDEFVNYLKFKYKNK